MAPWSVPRCSAMYTSAPVRKEGPAPHFFIIAASSGPIVRRTIPLTSNSRRIVQVPVNYRCFEIPDRFVVGFGLDYNQLYRNLGYVAVMKPDRGA